MNVGSSGGTRAGRRCPGERKRMAVPPTANRIRHHVAPGAAHCTLAWKLITPEKRAPTRHIAKRDQQERRLQSYVRARDGSLGPSCEPPRPTLAPAETALDSGFSARFDVRLSASSRRSPLEVGYSRAKDLSPNRLGRRLPHRAAAGLRESLARAAINAWRQQHSARAGATNGEIKNEQPSFVFFFDAPATAAGSRLRMPKHE